MPKKSAGGGAPTKPSDMPKRYTYKIEIGEINTPEKLYGVGDTIDLDEGTARRYIEEGVRLVLEDE